MSSETVETLSAARDKYPDLVLFRQGDQKEKMCRISAYFLKRNVLVNWSVILRTALDKVDISPDFIGDVGRRRDMESFERKQQASLRNFGQGKTNLHIPRDQITGFYPFELWPKLNLIMGEAVHIIKERGVRQGLICRTLIDHIEAPAEIFDAVVKRMEMENQVRALRYLGRTKPRRTPAAIARARYRRHEIHGNA